MQHGDTPQCKHGTSSDFLCDATTKVLVTEQNTHKRRAIAPPPLSQNSPIPAEGKKEKKNKITRCYKIALIENQELQKSLQNLP